MVTQIELGGIVLDVVKKDIQNIHLSVYPPSGKVKIAAPVRMKLDTIRLFAISKLGWIKKQQQKLREQERESRREFIDRESHHVWGRRVLLKVVEADGPPSVQLRHTKLLVSVRPGTDEAGREAIVSSWYRQLLKAEISLLIATWEPRLNVTVSGFYVQQMKTKWGGCNPPARTLRLNTELARKPKVCLEYIVVHEMSHLLEPAHGPRFQALMDRFLPAWRETRTLLNSLPAGHADWHGERPPAAFGERRAVRREVSDGIDRTPMP
jgi:predicted metal-dependent hydrolase